MRHAALFALALLALSSAPLRADTKSPWPPTFKTRQIRFDFAPGALFVDALAQNYGSGSQVTLSFSGSPNLDPMNGLPWQPMANYQLVIRYGNDGFASTVEQCAHIAELFAMAPAGSPKHFRIEAHADNPILAVDTQRNLTGIFTNEVNEIVCSIVP